MPHPAGPTRRDVLLGGVLALGAAASLTGCRAHGRATSAPTTTPGDQAARSLLAAAYSDELALLARYDAALRRRPELAATLRPVREHHARHRDALVAAGAQATGASATASTGGGSATTRSATLRALAAAEHAAADARLAECLHAPRALAALLGSLAASEATHADQLGDLGAAAKSTAGLRRP